MLPITMKSQVLKKKQKNHKYISSISLQNLMDNPLQHVSSFFLIFICCISLGLSSCENPGAVGSNLTNPESEVVIDTLTIDGVQALNPNSYSGELPFVSAGKYDDPVFGSMTAKGYLKPALPADSDSMHAGAKMLLRVILDANQIYGDTRTTQEFDIYEISELWRDRALMINDDLPVNMSEKVGSFSVETDEDSLTVELSQNWVDRYYQYTDTTNADSVYKYNMFGLALVPGNGDKIIPLQTDSTNFIIQNPEADTFNVSLNQRGYTLERGSNTSFPQGSVPLYSTYESVLNFGDLGLSELDIPPPGLSRAELVLYQNEAGMGQGLPAEPRPQKRPQEVTIDLHLAEPEYIPENIDPGVPLNQSQGAVFRVQGAFSETHNTYRFDITNLVERIFRSGFPENREFFVTFPNDGVIKPGLIYTDADQVPERFKPKVIITSLKNISN